ncbi:thiolase family protein [Stygiolobus caldivivus]|uniref:Acetyl-CoA synthetase n=1 Tax=Stygiolobus caldivivus TaxID=2824673 RepID=A0A8D5ZKH7_9CREN|nr:thiolase family protein [Stygiolobus caldivivus]BCU71282.1 acetyl-CoA synthetase [Stygiolobus caldivivus]
MVSIVASGLIKIDRYYEFSEKDLVIEAYKDLMLKIKDVPSSVDAMIVSSTYSDILSKNLMLAFKLSNKLGVKSPISFRVENGDNGGASILTAYSLVKSGIANSVLLVGVDKFSDYPSKYINDVVSYNLDNEYQYQLGLTPHVYAALLMKRYMKKYKKEYDYFTNWPLKMHENAVENPYAYLKFKVDKKVITDSQLISEPLRLFDIAARADGASVVLITSDDMAKKFTDTPVKIESIFSSNLPIDIANANLNSIKDVSRKAINKISKEAIYEIHDSYSILASLEIESLGLAEEGKALDELENLKVNLGGGLKARGYPGSATAIYQLAELYLQLTGAHPKAMSGPEKGILLSCDDLGNSSYLISLSR